MLCSYGETDRAERGECAVEGRCTVHPDVFLTCTCVRLYSYGSYHFGGTGDRGVRCLVDTYCTESITRYRCSSTMIDLTWLKLHACKRGGWKSRQLGFFRAG